MKRIWSLPLAALILVGCTTTPAPEQSRDKSPIEIIQEIPLVTLAVSYYSDGLESGKVVSNYDSEGFLVKEEVYNASQVLTEFKTGSRSSLTHLISSFNASGELQSSRTITFNESLKAIKEVFSNAKGEPLSISLWSFDSEGRVSSWSAQNGGGALLAVTTYLYNDLGQNHKIEIKDSQGLLTTSFVNDFNGMGQLLRKSEVDETGKILGYTVYEYKDKFLSQETQYSGDSILLRSISYLLNEKGWPSRISYLDRRGKVLEYKDLSYTVVTKKIMVQP